MDSEVLFQLRKFLSPEIVYGPGALGLAGRHAASLGASKVLIVTDPGVQAAGWTRKVEKSLSDQAIAFAVFNGVTANPKDHEVMSGAAFCQKEKCDLILAVGGGSPMDCAKGIGVVVGNKKHVLTFGGVDEIPHPGPPLLFIPTTAGSSADVSQFAVITDTSRGVKITIISKMVIPDISLVDPQTTLTMPPDLTAATGMDALCHACEAYVSNVSSPLTDMAALRAAALIGENLVAAFDHPRVMEYRDNMMMASLMAGLAFSNAGLGLVHAMAHSLGGALGLAHGECNAILLEKAIGFNYPAATAKYDQLARVLAGDIPAMTAKDPSQALREAVAALRDRVGLYHKLGDMGVCVQDLLRLSVFAADDPCLSTNPRNASPEQIETLYRSLL